MNKYILLVALLLSYAQAGEEDIGFFYGVLGKKANNPKTIVSYVDSSRVTENDQIKINVAYRTETNFYAIYLGPGYSLDVLYSSYDVKPSRQDTTSQAVLPWISFDDSKGDEIFYFVNLKDSAPDLDKLIKKHSRSKSKLRKKYAKKIVKILEEMNNPGKKQVRFKSRMDKPISVGAVFRGDDDANYNTYSLTHQERGKEVAIKKVMLIHE